MAECTLNKYKLIHLYNAIQMDEPGGQKKQWLLFCWLFSHVSGVVSVIYRIVTGISVVPPCILR